MLKSRPALRTFARVLALVFALSVGGYLVYCAQRDAQRVEEREPVFMPSSKAAPVRITRDPGPQKHTPVQQQETQPGKKKTLLPSSKSGVLRLPGEAG